MIPNFFAQQALTFEQVKSLTHGLLAVARVDGVHDNEMALVRQFYDECSRAGDPRLEEVAQGEFDAENAAKLFDTQELRQMFVKSLILLAFADGSYAQLEDDAIRKYAGIMGLEGPAVDSLLESTRDFLLSSLTHIRNTEALTEVMKKLSL